jgi:DNA-directed RNA polymerase specialized sigma24 family protein
LGFRHEAEDFIQEIILNRLEGIGLKQTPKQAIIDLLRKSKRGTRVTRAKNPEPCYATHSLESPGMRKEVEALALKRGESVKDRKHRDEILDLEYYLKGLEVIPRALMVLCQVYGLSLEECAAVLGLTPDRCTYLALQAKSHMGSKISPDKKRRKGAKLSSR